MEKILKTSIKNLFAIVLSTVVALSVMVTNAFALNSTTDTINVTINSLEANTEVKIYKIIDVNWDDTNQQPKAPVYTWNKDFVADVNAKFKVEGTSDELIKGWKDVTSPIIEEQLETLANTANTKKVTPVQTLKSETETSVTHALPMGEYLIVAKSATKIYKPTTVAVFPKYNDVEKAWQLVASSHMEKTPLKTSITLNMKGEPVDIPDKTIVNPDPNGYQVGSTVDFKVDNLKIPTYPSNETKLVYVIKDKMSNGLTFYIKTLKVFVDNQEVAAGPNTYEMELGDDATFTITFAQKYIRENAGKAVVLTYSTKVNENALVFNSTKNTVEVQFNNNVGTGTGSQKDEIIAFTYGFEATKKHNAGDAAGLPNAVFTLKTEAGTANLKFKKAPDGTYVLAEDQNTPIEGVYTDQLTVDANGKLKVVGLKLGTYVLTEIKAPAGYILAKNPITFTLVDNKNAKDELEPDGTLDACIVTNPNTEANGNDQTTTNNIFEFDVFNLKDGEIELPNTGGMGTVIFTVGGIVLMVGSAFFLVASRKRNEQ